MSLKMLFNSLGYLDHRNNIIFKSDKSKSTFILELVKKIVYEARVYKKYTALLKYTNLSMKVVRSNSWMQVKVMFNKFGLLLQQAR